MDEERKAELNALLAELEEGGGRETKGSPTCTVCKVQKASPDTIQVHVELKPDIGVVTNPRLVVKKLKGDFVAEASLADLSDDEWVAEAAFSLPPMAWEDTWPEDGMTEFFIEVENQKGDLELNGPYLPQ